ncbi:MAG: UDP-N-acetylmuramoyl-tripeptide--D-alanyl-D-alanine ligase [Bacteroidia bacterium]
MPQSKLWEAFQRQKAVSTDTRKIKSGDIFFALKGDNFDGNKFAAGALTAGAAFAVVDDPQSVPSGDDRYIFVPNVLLALQHLARQYRETFSIPVVALTGSNGKTTSKEFIYTALKVGKRAYATQGNLNNHIGVPLTLLAMPQDTEIAVIEMGANKRYDIEELVNIALPTHGLITNVGYAHLEGMGGIEGVQRTKGEMFDFIREHGGMAFVFEGDPRVKAEAHDISKVLGYGGADSPFRLIDREEFEDHQVLKIQTPSGAVDVTINLLGAHNATNALLAVTVGSHFGIPVPDMQAALAAYIPRMNRSQLHHQGNRTFLLDAYNANPSSMQASISAVAEQDHPTVALVLGDMFELGPTSPELHAGIWAFARQALPMAKIVGIGPHFSATKPAQDQHAVSYPGVPEAQVSISQDLEGYRFVLLKGSRGMALERLLKAMGVNLDAGH